MWDRYHKAVTAVQTVAPGVFLVLDTCNVYVIRAEHGRTGVAVDFGSGAVLDHLAEMGMDRLTHVVMTHHHRDQGQGLQRAVTAGVEVHVPPVERELFDQVDRMWDSRPLARDYNLRQDRFSLLEPVPVDGVVPEYRTGRFGAVALEVHPTPGHTTGSVSYVLSRGGRRIAFTGDLIYAPGKVWSLAASQWSYSGDEGAAMATLSCYLLLAQGLTLLLPSHGAPIADPEPALGLLAQRLQRYVDSRRPHPWDLRRRLDDPFLALTDHLLINESSTAYGYVLLSRTGAALLIDYGYDMTTGLPAGPDRASRRPWLASLPALRRNYGVSAVEVVLPTHYHDDHVAGINLLRAVEGTQVWSPANVAPILTCPGYRDLPCQWFDAVLVDKTLALGETFSWQEYQITVHELPGHTLYAAAYEFEVDGVRVLATGDQQDGDGIPGVSREVLNYQYRNQFRMQDYRRSADLYHHVGPNLIISGHWGPRWVDLAYLQMMSEQGEEVVAVHRDLLPLEDLDLPADGVLARLLPYASRCAPGEARTFTVTVRNPHRSTAPAVVRGVVPTGWSVTPECVRLELAGGAEVTLELRVTAPPRTVRRARVAVDVSVGALRLGQHAEAVIEVIDRVAGHHG